MQLQVGDQITDESGTWQVIARPYSSAGGKNTQVRLQRAQLTTLLPRFGDKKLDEINLAEVEDSATGLPNAGRKQRSTAAALCFRACTVERCV